MTEQRSAPSIVVGIDGSRSAVDAALWAVDEAVSRDIPLRLVYAIDPDAASGPHGHASARDLAAAEVAIRQAITAVEATDKPVKIEVEILQAPPVRALADAARWAAMLCVGSIGLKHSSAGRIGSTASVLAASVHCPVAIVHGHESLPGEQRWVVAEVDGSSTSDGVLTHALEEAQLRSVPLRVVATWQPRYTDIHDNRAIAGGNRLARARLDRRLTEWRNRYPDLTIDSVVVRGTFPSYVTEHAKAIELLVIARERCGGVNEVIGSPVSCALREAHCSVLISDPLNVL